MRKIWNGILELKGRERWSVFLAAIAFVLFLALGAIHAVSWVLMRVFG